AARALAPSLSVHAQDLALEKTALQRLACWAGGYTSRVVLMAEGDGLLLDIGPSLKLFGGQAAIAAQAAAELADQAYAGQWAAAPTPLAARWLAQWRPGCGCPGQDAMVAALDDLPVAVLPEKAAAALESFGMANLAAVRRLPSAELGQRIGAETLALLARAYGELPDPRAEFVFPERFEQRLELPFPVESAPALLFAARRLAAALAGWLSVRQAAITACTLHLRHRRGSTPLALGFIEAHRDASRIERVLRERLERLPLAAPVEALQLEAAEIRGLPAASGSLFDQGGSPRESIAALLEKLRARLGEGAVRGLAIHADHRPENASAFAAPGTAPGAALAMAMPPGPPRPTWLLPQPAPLVEVRGRPSHHGPLTLLAGPERIESGWWDGGEGTGDARRDYFVALSRDQRWLWIFRECRLAGGWFLHGWFA
ncbi:MAG TPA: DNA polymerase Y family protein, partial [Rhodocyclaceae bacterium]